jgi:hypothetical protein
MPGKGSRPGTGWASNRRAVRWPKSASLSRASRSVCGRAGFTPFYPDFCCFLCSVAFEAFSTNQSTDIATIPIDNEDRKMIGIEENDENLISI